MICENCNKEIDNDSKFCTYCGNKTNSNNNETPILNEKETSIKEFYFSYQGSIGRKEFFFRAFLPLTTILINLIALFQIVKLLSVMDKLPKDILILSYISIGILWLILQILIFITVIKRLHNCNLNAWVSILILIPIVNIFATIGLFLIPTKTSNKFGNQISNYKFSKVRWSLLIIEIIFIIFALFTFSFAKGFERIELENKQQQAKKYQKDYLGNYKVPIKNILFSINSTYWTEINFIKVSIEIKSKSPKIIVFVEENQAEIIDKIINLFSTRTKEELLIPGYNRLLSVEIIDEISKISNNINISDVVFTEYIIAK